jgi:hypothetical protein
MTLLLLCLSLFFVPPDTTVQTTMHRILPSVIGGWTASDSAGFYSGEEIFDYMDGAGEIYRSYNFKNLLVQKYNRPKQEEILVELFDMGSARNAYGVYTYMQGHGTKVNIGQDGEYKRGLLFFWKGKYFVCVKSESDNQETSRIIFNLGTAISRAIPKEGKRPAVLKYLPVNKYIQKSLCFFYRYEMLNIHYFVSDKNILNLSDSTDGILVRVKSDSSYLILVGYPNQAQTDSAYKNFLAEQMPNVGEDIFVQMENKKWKTCLKYKKYLIVLFDARSKDDAIVTLTAFKGNLP